MKRITNIIIGAAAGILLTAVIGSFSGKAHAQNEPGERFRKEPGFAILTGIEEPGGIAVYTFCVSGKGAPTITAYESYSDVATKLQAAGFVLFSTGGGLSST